MKRIAMIVTATAYLCGARPSASAANIAAAKERRASPSAVERTKVIGEADLGAELRSHKGHAVILHFWATWCAPCLEELPLVARLARDSKRKGIDFVAVSLDDPDPRSAEYVGALLARSVGDPHWSTILKVADVAAFMKRIDPDWEGVIPVFFAYDRDLRLRRSHLGNIGKRGFDKLVAGLAPFDKR
jgi:thiol-disulfide isomerase/thioredoxin